MATYDKLDWVKKNKLQEFYEQVNPKPSDLQRQEEPKSGASKLVRADGESRVFVEMPVRARGYENLVRLTMQIGANAHNIEMTVEEATILFNEMARVIQDTRKVNEVRQINLAAEKALKEAISGWERQRDQFLREAIKKHRITWEMIDEAVTPEDLPCFQNGSA